MNSQQLSQRPVPQNRRSLLQTFAAATVTFALLTLSACASNAAPTAPTTAGTFLYDTDAQDLFWDQDGSGVLAPIEIAHFTTAVNLTANDFDIVA